MFSCLLLRRCGWVHKGREVLLASVSQVGNVCPATYCTYSKQIQDSLVGVVAQKLNHTLCEIRLVLLFYHFETLGRDVIDFLFFLHTSGMMALPSLPLTYLKGISTLSEADTWMLGRSM